MTTIKLSGGDFGPESMLVRCDLSRASAPVEMDVRDGDGWRGTQYQCADARHSSAGLMEIARILAARACEMPESQFRCNATIVG